MTTISTSASVNNNVKNISANFKPFNLEAAKKGAKIVTRDGKSVTFICVSRDKVVAIVRSNFASYQDRQYKFNLDGSRYSSNLIHNLDLMMAA